MEIGLFQLESLILSRVQFCFLNLSREAARDLPEPVEKVLSQAERVQPDKVEARLNSCDKDMPIVLVCGDGKVSSQVGRRLETLGFKQIYTIEGGIDGMRSDL